MRNIEQLALRNNYYRRVIETTSQMQLVIMSLDPGEDIPMEVHTGVTQFIRVESGQGVVTLGGRRRVLRDGAFVIVRPGIRHHVVNTSPSERLKLYTLYSPPQHPRGRKDRRQPPSE